MDFCGIPSYGSENVDAEMVRIITSGRIILFKLYNSYLEYRNI